ncbi:MAG: hypothetical protein JXB42_10070 [Deltaproteobacteria bacterium]|nr:hypothetical protein [Deltaproteobacteria bacterium]
MHLWICKDNCERYETNYNQFIYIESRYFKTSPLHRYDILIKRIYNNHRNEGPQPATCLFLSKEQIQCHLRKYCQ